MADIQTNLKKVELSFLMTITDLMNGKFSYEFLLCKVQWKIEIVEREDGGESVVDVFLVCSPELKSNDSEWSLDAKASISLRSVKAGLHPITKQLPRTTFKKSSKSHGIKSFAKMTELEANRNGFEDKKQIIFDIQLMTNPLKIFKPSAIEQMRSVFYFKIEEMSQLEPRKSPAIHVNGADWSILVKKVDERLAVFLIPVNLNEYWTWEVECSFSLLSSDKDVVPFRKQIERTFTSNVKDWGFLGFITWAGLMDPAKKYVENDTASFEIDLKVSSLKPFWDIDQTQNQPNECPICLQSVVGREPVSTKCGHLFCDACIRRSIQQNKKCPMCHSDADIRDLRRTYI